MTHPSSAKTVYSLLLLTIWFTINGWAQNRIKKTDYEYDLVSGNVKQITYQAGRPDTYVQQYKYDADNRITEVRSSSDGVIFNRDAAYTYYQHGPVARTVIGDNKVQGLDYTYTLQGWIKGVNSNVMDMVKDPGKDGQVAMKTARDVFSYSLGYYNNDYTSIGGSMQLLATIGTTNLNAANSGLFNGNIRHMITSLTDNNGVQMDGQGYRYQYDQLNRIKKSEMFVLDKSTNSFTTPVSNLYKETFGYDSNGNIASLTRNGNNSVSPGMDQLNYVYALEGGKKQNNRLLHVNDGIADEVYSTDIDDQKTFVANDPATWNYQYDGIGNLVRDKKEEIEEITWNVQGKIKTVHRLTGSTQPDLEFKYDALGNRICKIQKPFDNLANPTQWIYTYYVLDAKGNQLAVYEEKPQGATQRILLKEQYVYGTKRLGSIKRDVDVTDPFLPMPNATPTFERILGKKQYELTNHLGNVLEVISDKRNAHIAGGTVDYYQAQVVSATDYYAFGSPMPGRDKNSTEYRFGFNGMEKDDDVKGSGNSYTTEFRQYDSRLGKWLSLDPKMTEYPNISPFVAFENNPLYYNDPRGDAPNSNRPPAVWELHEEDVTKAVVDKFSDKNILINQQVQFEYNGKTYITRPDNLTRVKGQTGFINIDAKSGAWKWTEAQRALNEALESGQVVKATIVDDANAKGLGLFSQDIEIVGQEKIVKGEDITKRVAEIADKYNFKALGGTIRRAGQYIGAAVDANVKLPKAKIPKWVKVGKLVPAFGIIPGLYSMTENLKNGNESAATIDAIGLLVDPVEWYLFDISDAH